MGVDQWSEAELLKEYILFGKEVMSARFSAGGETAKENLPAVTCELSRVSSVFRNPVFRKYYKTYG